jgi:hypothetical protein
MTKFGKSRKIGVSNFDSFRIGQRKKENIKASKLKSVRGMEREGETSRS